MVERIRRACEEKGLTMAELEKRAGLPDNSIYKWDKHSPSAERVARVARALGVTTDSILFASDEDAE